MKSGHFSYIVWKQEKAGGEFPPRANGGASPFSGVGAAAAAAAAAGERRLFLRTFRLTNCLENEKKRCIETDRPDCRRRWKPRNQWQARGLVEATF